MSVNLKTCCLFIFFFIPVVSMAQYQLQGYVYDKETNEPLPAAHVYDEKTLNGTTTDENGYFRIMFSKPKVQFKITFLGYRTLTRTVVLDSTESVKTREFYLDPRVMSMNEVTVREYRTPDRLINGALDNYEDELKNLEFEADVFYRWVTKMDSVPTELAEAAYIYQNRNNGDDLWKMEQGRIAQNLIPSKGVSIQFANLIDVQRTVSVFEPVLGMPMPLDQSRRINYQFEIKQRDFIDTLEVYHIRFFPKNSEAPFQGTITIETNDFNVVAADIRGPNIPDPEVKQLSSDIIRESKFSYENTSFSHSFKSSPVRVPNSDRVVWLNYYSKTEIVTTLHADVKFKFMYAREHNLEKPENIYTSKITTTSESYTYRYRLDDFKLTPQNASQDSDFFEAINDISYNYTFWHHIFEQGIPQIDPEIRPYFMEKGRVDFLND